MKKQTPKSKYTHIPKKKKKKKKGLIGKYQFGQQPKSTLKD